MEILWDGMGQKNNYVPWTSLWRPNQVFVLLKVYVLANFM